MQWVSYPPIRWFAQGLTFFVFLVAGLFFFSAIKGNSGDVDQSIPLLMVDEGELDFGSVSQTMQHEITFHVRNISPASSMVVYIEPSCICTTVSPSSFEVPSQHSQLVTATLDLSDAVNGRTSNVPVSVSVDAVVVSPRREVHKLEITGNVRQSLLVEPRRIDLIGIHALIDGTPPDDVVVDVRPQIDIVGLSAKVSNELGNVICEKVDERLYQVRFSPRANHPRGPLKGDLTLTASISSEDDGPTVSIPIRGQVSGPVQFSPPQVLVTSFGNKSTSGLHATSLTGRDGSQWKISSVESDCDFLHTLVTDDRTRVTVFINETDTKDIEALPQQAALTVRAESDDGRRENLVLPVHLTPLSRFSNQKGDER